LLGFKVSITTVLVLIFVLTFLPVTAVYGQEKVDNFYFSLKVPKTWTYAEYSNTGMASLLGRGPVNDVYLTPSEFGELLVNDKDSETAIIDRIGNGGVYSQFVQDTDYSLKNAPLEAYVKYRIAQLGDNWNVTSMDNGTIGKQKAVKISANGTNESANIRKVEYLVLHDKDPYALSYIANVKDYDKYLPEFEQMVRSFKFVS
jgi:VCBS repeat-containing protein